MPKATKATVSQSNGPSAVTPYSTSSSRAARRCIRQNVIRQLESHYAWDPWPTDRQMEWLEHRFMVPFDLLFKWYAERRAQAVGLAGGSISTIPDECRDYISWKFFVVDFIEDYEQRAETIQYLQEWSSALIEEYGSDMVHELPEVEGHTRELDNFSLVNGESNLRPYDNGESFSETKSSWVPYQNVIPVEEESTVLATASSIRAAIEGDELFSELIVDFDVVLPPSPSTTTTSARG